MSKNGYKCHKWTDEENELIRKYYINKSNQQLAEILNNTDAGKEINLERTADAVRKQINALKLHRVKKSEIKQLQKKAGKLDFFGQIAKGRLLRNKNQAEQQRLAKKKQEAAKEEKFAREFLGEEYKAPVQKSDDGMIWLHLDHKTSVKIHKDKAEKYKAQWQKQQIQTQ